MNTKLHTFADVLESLCRDQNAWGLYLSAVSTNVEDLNGATGFTLDVHVLIELMGHGSVYVTFPTEEEMRRVFGSVVGDDGPTATNPYDGPCRVYALCCSPEGKTLSENT